MNRDARFLLSMFTIPAILIFSGYISIPDNFLRQFSGYIIVSGALLYILFYAMLLSGYQKD